MILECAILNVKPGKGIEFQQAFAEAEPIIKASPGYLSHELLHCIEHDDRYLLLAVSGMETAAPSLL
jgi:heme-degrading monooxygenase HmoA